MATFVNRAKVSTSTTGTGTITLGAAEDGYQTFAAAGVGDGDSVRYTIEDGSNWEIGTGTYTASGTTLSRTPSESSNAGAAINLSGGAVVFVTALATDFTSPTYTNLTTTGTVDFSGATVSDLGTVTTANIDGGDIASAVTINKSPTVTLTGAITGSGTLTNLGNVSIATTATSDPTLTMAGDISGSATFTNLGNATLTATVVGGDVDTAAAWTTARTLSLTGAVTGSVSIDGSANASIATTATSDPTLTLSGDATGSATFTNLGNATLAVTVVGGDVDTATSATTATTATTANAWTTARTVSLTGAVTGSASVDGSANVSIATTATSDPTLTLSGDVTGSATFTNLGNATLTATVVDDSHNHIISNVDGLQTALDGKLGSTANAVSASKWATARTVSLTGAVTGSASVDGSANVSIATTATSDPTITLTGAVTGSGTMTNLGNVSIATTATADPTLTLTGDVTGSATFTNLGNATLTATVANDSHTHNWANITSGARTNYTLQFKPPSGNYAGFEFLNDNGTGAGYFLIRSTASSSFPPYTAGGITLVSDSGGLNFFARGGTQQLVRMGTGNTETFRLESNYSLSLTSSRAPIFYDSNNTGYYTDPASTSVMNNIYLEGAIYHNGDTNTYIQFHAADQWRVVTGGGERLEVNSSFVLAQNQMRAPIYYDNANTAYYFDGNATGDSIRVAGNIVAYYSDERLKTKVGAIDSPVEKVKALSGFKYHANETAEKLGYSAEKVEVGVSAQEVEAVLPEVVRDAPIGQGYKTVQYERLVPLLIEAIKEQAGQIEALQAEVAKLKG